MDTGVGSKPSVGRDGSICGEALGAMNEGWGAGMPLGVSNPVKAGRAGRLARREIGCCPCFGDGGRAGSLASELGDFFSTREEEIVCTVIFRRKSSSASNFLDFDMRSCCSFFNSSISASFFSITSSSFCFSLRKPSIL